MLSMRRIERDFSQQQFQNLLDAVLENGMTAPLPLRVRLSHEAVRPIVAAALGLRRLIELTYGPTGLSRSMVDFLVNAQEQDGSYAGDPLATASAAAALGRVLRDHGGLGENGTDQRVTHAYHAAIHALSRWQDQNGLFSHGTDRSDDDRSLTTAFVLYLLLADEQFRATIRVSDVLSWFEMNEHMLTQAAQELWQMGRLTLPSASRPPMVPQSIATVGRSRQPQPAMQPGRRAARLTTNAPSPGDEHLQSTPSRRMLATG